MTRLSRPPRKTPWSSTSPVTATFSEKLDFGYRWNERMGIKPGFAFGHGLSYTAFDYSDLEIKTAGDGLDVSFAVTDQPDGTQGKWVIAKGNRHIMVGAASDDVRLEANANE